MPTSPHDSTETESTPTEWPQYVAEGFRLMKHEGGGAYEFFAEMARPDQARKVCDALNDSSRA